MTGHSKWANIKHRRGARNRPRGSELRELTYEGYGPGGTAVIVTCATARPDHTLAALRATFARHGGHLGAAGSVAYLFNEVGLLSFPEGEGRKAIAAAALEAGAEDVVANDDGSVDVLTDPRDFTQVWGALERGGLHADAAEVTWRSSVNARLDERDAPAMLMLVEALENLDDVQDIYCNADIPADVLARLESH